MVTVISHGVTCTSVPKPRQPKWLLKWEEEECHFRQFTKNLSRDASNFNVSALGLRRAKILLLAQSNESQNGPDSFLSQVVCGAFLRPVS